MGLRTLKTVPANDHGAAIAALDHDGVVVLDRLFAPDLVDAVRHDIAPALDAQEAGGGAFYGNRAKRVSRVLALSPSAQDMIAHDALTAIADTLLGPHCLTYRLQLLSALEVWGGGDPQPLHRDAGVYAPFLAVPGPHEYMFTVMLAGTDFSRENGGTRLALGSHRWDRDRTADDSEIAFLEMAKGSVAIWLGSVLHGMGVNTSQDARLGVVWGYSLGWLRQEQEAMLVLPPETARQTSEKVRRIVGYQSHGPLLGWVGGNSPQSPGAALEEGASKLLV